MTEKTTITGCNLCEAWCGIEVKTDGADVISIRGNDNDVYSKGYICPKATALADIYNDPDRLRHPVRRTANGWEKISWQTALDETAQRIVEIQKKHGNDALGIYWGNPPTHNHGIVLTMLTFFMALGTKNRYSAASVDQLPQYLVSYKLYGNQLMFPISDIDRTDFWLIFGANPVVSNGSITAAPNMRGRIKAIKKRGGRVVVIDPRRTQTAKVAEEHITIRPGTDILLLLAILQVIVAENLVDLGRVADLVDNLDHINSMVTEFTPEYASQYTGIPSNSIRQLARDFASAESAVAYGRLGVAQNDFGTLCHWLINLLNIMTGNLDKVGGAMFTTPAFDLRRIAKLITGGGHYAKWHSRVRNLPEFSDEFPVATLADEMLTAGDGQIKAMLLLAGNPVLTVPESQKISTGLGQLDFCVAVDFYINESTQYADIILPPVSHLERGNYEVAIAGVSVRNNARYSQPVFLKPADGKEDWEIIVELHSRIMCHKWFLGSIIGSAYRKLMNWLTPDFILDLGIRTGSYRGLSLKKIKETPDGIDLGALKPQLPKALYTKNKRIDLAPVLFMDDVKRIRPHFMEQSTDSLLLIGRRHLRSNNSWMHNSHRLVKGSDRCTMLIHPTDAETYQLTNGDTACVTSSTGEIAIPVEISDDVPEGVVSIPHGWGHSGDGVLWQTAKNHAGVNVNIITDSSRIDPVSGNAVVNAIPVQIRSIK